MNKENKLDAQINIPKFARNVTKYYSLSVDQDWVRDYLIELNEKADDKSPEEYLKETSIQIELEILKKFTPATGEYLLIKGSVETTYATQCVRTLTNMHDSLSTEFKVCFIDDLKSGDDQYADQTETFQENEMYDLYFFVKNKADIKEVIHEQIFLNINQYPIHDAEAELVWANGSSDNKQ